jgi:inner membrane protein
VGAALGESGLKQRTRFGSATLMIAANLPDIDVLVFATDTPAVSFRRGWTHGILAQALLPIALTAVIILIRRLLFARSEIAGQVRTRNAEPRTSDPEPRAPFDSQFTPALAQGMPDPDSRVSVSWTLALAYIGVYSHVALDYLNNYGVRLLSPLDWRWFYGDSLFIVDPWLWATLGLGVWLARRRVRPAPARAALLVATTYVLIMVATAQAARRIVIDSWRQAHGSAPAALMVGPVPVVPFVRQVIVDAGDHYETGQISWPSATVQLTDMTPKHHDGPEVARAHEVANVRAFLVWSRFPYWELQAAPSGTRVTVRDMRFGDRFAASTIVEK